MFETPEELQKRVTEYFDSFLPGQSRECQRFETHPTITGLCLFLGFESRQSFYDYEKREGFSYTIKRSRLTVENFYEHLLTDKNPAGPIFALKNMGWADKQEIDHTTQGEKMVFGGVQIIKPDEAIHPPAE